MPALPSLGFALAALALAAGCSSMGGRTDAAPPAVPLRGSFEPAAPAVAEQATRFYVDDKGAVWDDRGRKREACS